jgi:hypothetical protein
MSTFGLPIQPFGETISNAPNPLPASGTANVALCNFTAQPVIFKVFGVQGGKAVNKEISVAAYTYLWSTGWATGDSCVLTASTPYNTKVFCPFVTSDLIAIFQA